MNHQGRVRGSAVSKQPRIRKFKPDELYVRVTHDSELPLRLDGAPNELVKSYEAKVWRVRGGPSGKFTESPVARIQFEHLAVSAWEGDGWSLHFDVADSLSGDLQHVFDTLFDEEGEPRAETKLSGVGDLLYIEMIEVEPGENVFEVVRFALEHVLGRFGHACMGAVYCQANWESIGVVRPLKDRGFRQSSRARNVWVTDLEYRRPPIA